jgi:hypothetical protein
MRNADVAHDRLRLHIIAVALSEDQKGCCGREGTLFRLIAVGSPAPPGTKCTCPIPPAGTFALCKCFYETK